MRVVALFRVSSERQASEGASLDAQERIYRELAAKNGWTTVGEFKGHESATQATSDRVVLQRVLHCVREERPDAVYVHEQSRLTRGDELEVAMLMRELREQNLKVLVGGVVRDLESIDERFMFGIQSLVDRAESERIKERLQRGKREKARQGKRACGAVPYGYRAPPPGSPNRGVLQVVPDQAAIVRRIFTLAAEGMGVKRIAATLNGQGIPSPRGLTWSGPTVHRILRCPAYLGNLASFTWVWDKRTRRSTYDPSNPRAVVVEGTHEAIIAREVWDAVHGRPKLPRTVSPHVLTGMLWVNGRPARGGNDGSHRCYAPPRGVRGAPWLRVEETDAAVWAAFASLATGPEFVAKLMEQAPGPRDQVVLAQEIEHLEDQLGRHTRRANHLLDMRIEGEITREVYEKKHAETEAALKSVGAELARLRARTLALDGTHAARVARAVGVLVAGQSKLTDGQRRGILTSIVRRVDVVAEDTGAKYQRDAKGHILPVDLNRWAIKGISFTLAIPDDAGRVAAAGGEGTGGRATTRDAARANVGPMAGDGGSAVGNGSAGGLPPGQLERRPLTPSRLARSGGAPSCHLERRICTPWQVTVSVVPAAEPAANQRRRQNGVCAA